MKNLYQELLLDHYAHPRNGGELVDPAVISHQYNPACGDVVSMTGHVRDDVLTDVKFKAAGCVITVASASLLSELILAQPLDLLASFDKELLLSRVGIPLGPTRLKCALLPLYALKDGITEYKKNNAKPHKACLRP